MTESPQGSEERRVQPDDALELTRIVAKLVGLYPRVPDVEVTLASYVDELKDIPPFWVGQGCKRLVRADANTFLPSVGEIRKATALAVRKVRRRQQGRVESAGHSGHEQLPVPIGQLLRFSHQIPDQEATREFLGLPSLAPPAWTENEQLPAEFEDGESQQAEEWIGKDDQIL